LLHAGIYLSLRKSGKKVHAVTFKPLIKSQQSTTFPADLHIVVDFKTTNTGCLTFVNDTNAHSISLDLAMFVLLPELVNIIKSRNPSSEYIHHYRLF